ncbi:MAG: monofunctional biosynthetic peptidoglycan transglycosylase [Burkholderiaceae bacterium]|nr:MAG: monofunctional biosynthetic peptidoglycan transglycosylase [Burkholderiaceae bacterium]
MKKVLRWSGHLLLWVLLALVLLQLWFFSCVLWWARYNPGSSSFMRAEEVRLQEKNPAFKLQHQWADYGKISSNLKRAVIASEDGKFVEHDGVDWDAIEKAWEHNHKLEEEREKAAAKGRKPSSKPIHGGSTITQQVAKNLFLSGDHSYLRKGQELIITYMLEGVMDKRRILELYLNIAEWGEGVFGAEAAARHYFGVSAAQLDPLQAAQLAAMLPRPRFYDQHRDSAYLASRTWSVWMRMPDSVLP